VADRKVSYLLVGGGLASGNCARHLREQDAEGEILLVGREPDPPYNRPPLSKTYLRGEESKTDILVRPEGWFEENDVEVLTRTSVTSIDTNARVAKLSDKQEVEFDKALIATGSNVRILHADGAELDGIHYLRTLGNADSILSDAGSAGRVVLIGGSFISTELAASLTKLGKQCEVIMLESVVHERFAGPEVGRIIQDVLEEHGVKIHANQELERFEGADGRVGRVVTKAGLELDCDFVVIGAGVHPELRLAQQAGLEVADGVITNEFLETSVPGIYAAGDIAEYDSPIHRRRLRIEHWDVAFNQGRYAALNMLGFDQAYDVLPYFWSDLADWLNIEYVGPAKAWDEVWWRGDWGERKFTAWYIKDGKVAAALTVGRSEDLVAAGHLLMEGTDVSDKRAVIEDADSDLGEIR